MKPSQEVLIARSVIEQLTREQINEVFEFLRLLLAVAPVTYTVALLRFQENQSLEDIDMAFGLETGSAFNQLKALSEAVADYAVAIMIDEQYGEMLEGLMAIDEEAAERYEEAKIAEIVRRLNLDSTYGKTSEEIKRARSVDYSTLPLFSMAQAGSEEEPR